MDADPKHPELESLLANGTWVRDLVRKLLYDKSLTDDVVQEVWIAALRKPPRAAGALRTWLFRVAQALAFQTNRAEKRRQRREQATLPKSAPPSVEEVAQAFELRRVLEDAVLRLDEPYRSVVYLRYFENIAPAEIAARLGMNESTLRTQLSRAIDRLRQQLDRRYQGRKEWRILFLPLLFSSAVRAELFDANLPNEANPGSSTPPQPSRRGTWIATGTAVVVLVCTIVSLQRSGKAFSPERGSRTETTPLQAAAVTARAKSNPSTDAPIARAQQLASQPGPEAAKSSILVLDARNREPVANARVFVSFRTEERSQPLGLTDKDGALKVAEVLLRREAFQILAEGYIEHRESARLRELPDRVLSVELEPELESTVKVFLPDGAPAIGARVTIGARPRGLDAPAPVVRVTDVVGEAGFVYSFLDTVVTVDREGHATASLPAATPVTTIRLARGIESIARILDAEGAPLSGAVVDVVSSASRKVATSHAADAEGNARLGLFAEPEQITLTVRAAGEPVMSVSGKPSREPWTVRLPASSWARDRVTGPDGEPVTDAVVFVMTPKCAASREDGQVSGLRTPALPGKGRARLQLAPLARAATTQDGSFAVGPISKDADQIYLVVYHPRLRDNLERITAQDAAHFREVRLEEGASLSGRVITPSGRPLVGVLLHLGEIWSNDMESMVGRTRTGPDGSFQLEGLPESVIESLPGDRDPTGGAARRTALFITAFAPDWLIERRPGLDGDPPDEKSLLVEPGESGLEIVASNTSSCVAIDLRMRDELGRAVRGWAPALLRDTSGGVRNGSIGGRGESNRFFADSTLEIGDGRGCEIFLMPPAFAWRRVAVPQVSEGTTVEVQLAPSLEGSGSTRLLLPDGTPLEHRPLFLDAFPGARSRPGEVIALGTTDGEGTIDLGFLERGHHELWISRYSAANGGAARGDLVKREDTNAWLDLGMHELGRGVAAELRLITVP